MVQTASKKKKPVNKSPSAKKQAEEQKKRGRELRLEIMGFALLLGGIYYLFCMFETDAGSIGAVINKYATSLFGTSGRYVLGAALFINGVFFLAKFRPFTHHKGSVYLYIMTLNIICVCGFPDTSFAQFSFFELSFYSKLWNTRSPGGFIGQFISKLLIEMFSKTGAWIIVILIGIASFIMIFRKSITEAMQNRAQAIKEKINGDRRDESGKADLKPLSEAFEWGDDQNRTRARKKTVKNGELSDPLEKFMSQPPSAKQPDQKPQVKIKPEDAFEKAGEEKEAPLQNEKTTAKDDKQPSGAEKTEVKEQAHKKSAYVIPPVELLDRMNERRSGIKKEKEIMDNISHLEKTLADFGIDANVTEANVGPSVTRYELQLKPGIRVSRVVSLSDDIAMSLAAHRVRIEAPIPGKSAIGIEVPNREVSPVKLSQVISSDEFRKNTSPLCVSLGKDVSGKNLVMDVTDMPHVLIAGATGSGKSVCINSIIMSVLYRSAPEDVKMILIDPKMVELNVYEGIPHLLQPVVTDPKRAASVLEWAVFQMTQRYESFKENKVRGIVTYNAKTTAEGKEKMPYILIIIDELNDLMLVSAQQVEASIIRLSQLARAAGIHLVLATQRPSVNVITGVIKANIPARISFMVASQIDSRTILDQGGAEKLIGKGDMLFLPPNLNAPIRAQGTFVSDKEIERVVEFIKKQNTADYDDAVAKQIDKITESSGSSFSGGEHDDDLLPKAMEIAFEKGVISTSTIQRRLRLGYARAGRIIDEMEERGYISGADGSKPRKVLITQDEYFRGSGADS